MIPKGSNKHLAMTSTGMNIAIYFTCVSFASSAFACPSITSRFSFKTHGQDEQPPLNTQILELFSKMVTLAIEKVTRWDLAGITPLLTLEVH